MHVYRTQDIFFVLRQASLSVVLAGLELRDRLPHLLSAGIKGATLHWLPRDCLCGVTSPPTSCGFWGWNSSVWPALSPTAVSLAQVHLLLLGYNRQDAGFPRGLKQLSISRQTSKGFISYNKTEEVRAFPPCPCPGPEAEFTH